MQQSKTGPQRVNHGYLQWARHQRAPEVNRNRTQSISSSCCQNFSSDVLFSVLIGVKSAQSHDGTPISASVKRLQEPSPRSAAKCQINKPCAIGKCAAWLYFSGSFIICERIAIRCYLITNTHFVICVIRVSCLLQTAVSQTGEFDSKQGSACVTLRWVTRLAHVMSQFFTLNLLYKDSVQNISSCYW